MKALDILFGLITVTLFTFIAGQFHSIDELNKEVLRKDEQILRLAKLACKHVDSANKLHCINQRIIWSKRES